jgi:hypothetical protein
MAFGKFSAAVLSLAIVAGILSLDRFKPDIIHTSTEIDAPLEVRTNPFLLPTALNLIVFFICPPT